MPRSLALALTLSLLASCPVGAAESDRETRIRDAVTTGLALVQKAAENYPTHRTCFSCHHQTLPMFAMTAALGSGVKVDESLLQQQADFTLESFEDKREAMRDG